MKSLAYYHILHLLRSPATVLFLCAGWVSAILLTFIHGAFIAANRADLVSLFSYLPWVMAVLIPALVMPVADETRKGITERLRTLPHTPTQRLLARFNVYMGLLKLWILGFWPMAATIAYLGHPDLGQLFTSYVGAALLAMLLLAVTLTICLCARGGVRGFLIALAANTILLTLGLPAVQSWLAYALPAILLQPLHTAAPLAAYQPFLKGVLALGPIAFFCGTTAAILGLNLIWRHPRRLLQLVPGLLILIAIAGAAVTFIPAAARLQLDLTATRANSLAPATRTYIAKLAVPTTLTLFTSAQNPDLPPAVTTYTRTLIQTLAAMANVSHGKLRFKQIDADAQPQLALQAGLQQTQLPTGTAYFLGLQASSSIATRTIPALNTAAPDQQEADALRLLASVQKRTAGTITLISSQPIAQDSPWYQALTSRATVTTAAPTLTQIPADTSLLIIYANPALTSMVRDAILTYLNAGGSVLLLADPLSRNHPALQPDADTQLFTTTLSQWGLDFNSANVVADTSHATPVAQTATGTTSYPFWVQLSGGNLNAHVSFAQIPGAITWVEGGELTPGTLPSALILTPILTTAPSAQIISASLFAQVPAESMAANLNSGAQRRLLAARLTGAFTGSASRPATLIAFADVDWLDPQFAPVGSANLALFTGAVDSLLGNPILTTRNQAPRTLTRIETLYASLGRNTQALQQRIAADLYTTSQNLAEFQASNPDATQLNEAQQQQLADFHTKEFTLQQKLREVRQQTRTRIYWLENALLLLNLAAMPTLLAIAAFFLRRRPLA
jgi:ABC-2 type transport system permease protein